MNVPECFQYAHLQANEIRLIEILSGSKDDQIELQIRSVLLENVPEYRALSYTWGGEILEKPILVNGQRLLTTPSLDAALREFRSRPLYSERERFTAHVTSLQDILFPYLNELMPDPADVQELMDVFREGMALVHDFNPDLIEGTDEQRRKLASISDRVKKHWDMYALQQGISLLKDTTRLLWVDAICINQENFQERSEQIQNMQDIYKKATSLIVWLGPSTDNSEKALETLARFYDNPSVPFDNWMREHIREDEHESVCQSIIALFSRAWFKRSWVIQEYAFGGWTSHPNSHSGIMFCCGTGRIPNIVPQGLSAMVNSKLIDRSSPSLQLRWDLAKTSTALACLNSFREHSWNVKSGKERLRREILPLLITSNASISTDPRDKIYAILGIAQHVSRGSIADLALDAFPIDYKASTEEVFARFVRAYVIATKSLNILGLCTNWKQQGCIQRTWVPDWTVSLASGYLSKDISSRSGPTFDVTLGSECIANFAPDLSYMTVSCIQWDQVVASHSLLMSETFTPACEAFLTFVGEVGRRTKIYGTDSNIIEKYISLLLLDPYASYRKEPAVAITSNSFMDWMKAETSQNFAAISQQLTKDETQWETRQFYYMSAQQSSNDEISARTREFREILHQSIYNKSQMIIATKDGYIGRCNGNVMIGDLVCVLLGCDMPMLLRPHNNHYQLVGEAYVEGIMRGEAMLALQEGRKVLQRFELH